MNELGFEKFDTEVCEKGLGDLLLAEISEADDLLKGDAFDPELVAEGETIPTSHTDEMARNVVITAAMLALSAMTTVWFMAMDLVIMGTAFLRWYRIRNLRCSIVNVEVVVL